MIIGQVQAHVRQHHTHQGHQGQVQTLGQHLRADEHIGALVDEVRHDDLVSAFLAGCFGIPTQGLSVGEQRFYFLFHLLSAGAELADGSAAAVRAFRRHAAPVAAGMTQ